MGVGAGRNDSCPCGSGAKYKRCCLPRHEAAAAARHSGHAWDADPDTPRNHAIDLIAQGNLNEAEAIAARLSREFPELPDGHELRARAFEARGDRSKAAAELRQLRALLAFLGNGADFDPEFHQWLDGEIERLGTVTPEAADADA